MQIALPGERHLWRGLVVLALFVGAGCAEDKVIPIGMIPTKPGKTEVFCPEGAETTICAGGQVVNCAADGTYKKGENCLAKDLSCFPGFGCGVCRPGDGGCDGNKTLRCNDDGSGYDEGETCAGTSESQCDINTGACEDLCAAAENSKSYIGCEYWAATTSNLVDPNFSFAIVISNPQAVDAEIKVTRNGEMVAEETVVPGGVQTIKVPWVPEIKDADAYSVLTPQGAYRIEASVPVAAYEFSALEFSIPMDCPDSESDELGDDVCFSYTNDASLLFPTHVLRGGYMALGVPGLRTMQKLTNDATGDLVSRDPQDTPAFVTIIGAETEPTTITVRTPAHIAASLDGTTVAAMSPGDEATFTLAQGDVLELLNAFPAADVCPPASHESDFLGQGPCDENGGLCNYEYEYCALRAEYDLSGLTVESAGKVAVIAGHRCAFIPEDRFACDHLEESLPSFENWGEKYFVGVSKPLRKEPNYVRVVASKDDTTVTFSPGARGAVTLNRGEVYSFETKEDVLISSDNPILVAQFLVGQAYEGLTSAGAGAAGDPALSYVVPVEQYRKNYAFLIPDTYTSSFVTIIASSSQDVLVDGKPVTGWELVGETGYKSARVKLEEGTHKATSESPFGLTVYGYASFTSYLYPGGLDFNPIATPL